MSLKYGRPMVAIPGPSVIPDRVLNAMHRPMPNIYEGEIPDLAEGLFRDLGAVARTAGETFITVSNGHGGWEMALSNTLSRGDRVLVLESGRFAIGWGEMATLAGMDVEVLPGTDRGPVDPAAVAERLAADTTHSFKAVLVVQVDTATSVLNDIAAIGEAVRSTGHPALLMVDCIASLGCERYEMDEWGVDITVAGSQKGLMVPPGLGFVWASDRALEAHRSADLRTGYWDWTSRLTEGANYLKYAGTAPIAHLYGLREALDMVAEEGLENIWARHVALADAVRAAVERWAMPDGLELCITDPTARSNAVTTILTNDLDAGRLRSLVEDQAGLTLGLGVGHEDGEAFRIGHMGHLNPPMLLGTLATIEAGLLALGVPIGGSGIEAASASIAKALAI